jgi:uncharacterized Zn finger protein (UPF0148 family)
MEQLQKICPACGAPFTCEYELGKDCWCAKEFPSQLPVPEKDGACYCAACLKQRVAQPPEAEKSDAQS